MIEVADLVGDFSGCAERLRQSHELVIAVLKFTGVQDFHGKNFTTV